MQEDVSEEWVNKMSLKKIVSSHEVVTAAINSIKEYISADDENSHNFDTLYGVDDSWEKY